MVGHIAVCHRSRIFGSLCPLEASCTVQFTDQKLQELSQRMMGCRKENDCYKTNEVILNCNKEFTCLKRFLMVPKEKMILIQYP